jgi:hypothetical protein
MRDIARRSPGSGRCTRQRGGYLRQALVAALLALMALSWPWLAAQPALADDRPPGGVLSDPVVRAVDIASPAVVRIIAVYTARITFFICGQSITLPANGGTYTIGWSGSGAFVSANGDILTAGHVVDDSAPSLEAGIFESPRSSPDIAQLLDDNASCLHLPTTLTPNDVAQGAVQDLGIPYQAFPTKPTFSVFDSTSFSGTLSAGANSNGVLATLEPVPHEEATVLAFSTFVQDDLAVVHVNLQDTPSIQLDDSAAVAPQDKLTIIGFPGNGDLDPELGGNDPTNLLTPSVNTIVVSAIKHNGNGSQLIQVGGNVEHGDSGGPALDADGRIVGVVSFGGLDQPDGTSFLRASNSALRLIQQASVNTQSGAFQRAWQQAFTDYAATYAGHWHKAAQELDALSAKYPDFHGVMPYKAYADVAATREQVTLGNLAPDVLIVGGLAAGVLVLLIVVVLVSMVASRRRRSQARAAASMPRVPVG